jgi:predicted metal-dependent phosphoesterase TrpH
VIDLHLHTTASDGLLAPDALVARVAAAGIHTFSITDHDTVAGLAQAAAAARLHGLRFLPGIEVTAVDEEGDIHMLGYGFDPEAPALAVFLRDQRAARVVRVRAMIRRLADMGMTVDEGEVLAAASDSGRAVGRPQIARALMARGVVSSVSQAFDVWLGRGRPAYVPRTGASPAEVIAIVSAAGGLVSMAHPGVTRRDDLIAGLASRGLGALEVWHSDHDARASERYQAQAAALGLLATGGSDFHGDSPDRPGRLGEVGLPAPAFDLLLDRLRASGSARFIQDLRP